MTKSTRAWHLTLIVGLGLSLAPWIVAAEAHTSKSGSHGEVCVQNKHLRNSPEVARGDQAEARADLVVVQAPEVRPGPLSQRFPQGSHLVRLAPSDRTPHSLTPNFFTAADPRISFDGAHVLFAAKKTADSSWQIWESNVDGSDVRQITHGPGDCLKPAYLPRGQIVYTALAEGPAGGMSGEPVATHIPLPAGSASTVSQIWVSKVDGSDAHPITFGPGDFEVETVLKNGMILATARSPLLPSSRLPADRELYTLRLDGTGLATLRCDHQHPAVRSQAQELDDGAVIFVKSSLGSRSLGGDLAWIPRGALHDSLLTSLPIPASSPQPIGADKLLVARESAAGLQLTLYAFDAAVGRFLTPIYTNPKLSAVEAVPVAARETPRWYWSTLNPTLQRGYFICLNSYLAEGVPHGRIAAKLTCVRVLTLDAATQRESLLGEAPMEEDGSFYIAVPPDKPVRFEVLDAAGRVVRAQRSWIWSRSGEEHGCVGCHEDRAVAPENRWPLALRRFDTPTRLDLPDHPVSAH
jgi:hypothetical protein